MEITKKSPWMEKIIALNKVKLMELYIMHGDREFTCVGEKICYFLRVHGFLVNAATTKLTSKALKFIKEE